MNRRQALFALAPAAVRASAVQDWVSLFDGRTLNGWKANQPASWRVDGGAIAADGPVSHLFYDGAGAAGIENFELEAEVLTRPFANSGIYLHTAYQASGFPRQGFEVQVNNTALGEGGYRERKRTGSLYGMRNVHRQLARDHEWFALHVRVSANNVQARVNGMLTVDCVEPTPAVIPPSQETARFLQKGLSRSSATTPARTSAIVTFATGRCPRLRGSRSRPTTPSGRSSPSERRAIRSSPATSTSMAHSVFLRRWRNPAAMASSTALPATAAARAGCVPIARRSHFSSRSADRPRSPACRWRVATRRASSPAPPAPASTICSTMR